MKKTIRRLQQKYKKLGYFKHISESELTNLENNPDILLNQAAFATMMGTDEIEHKLNNVGVQLNNKLSVMLSHDMMKSHQDDVTLESFENFHFRVERNIQKSFEYKLISQKNNPSMQRKDKGKSVRLRKEKVIENRNLKDNPVVEKEEDEEEEEEVEEEYIPVFKIPENHNDWKFDRKKEEQKELEEQKEIDKKLKKMKTLSGLEKKFVKKYWFNFDLDSSPETIKDHIIKIRTAFIEISACQNDEELNELLEKYKNEGVLRDRPKSINMKEFEFLNEVMQKNDDINFQNEMVKRYAGVDEKGKTPVDYAKNEEEKKKIRERAYFEAMFGKKYSEDDLDIIEKKISESFSKSKKSDAFNISEFEKNYNDYMVQTFGPNIFQKKIRTRKKVRDISQDINEEVPEIEYSLTRPKWRKGRRKLGDIRMSELANLLTIFQKEDIKRYSKGKTREEQLDISLKEWISYQEIFNNLSRHELLMKNLPDHERFFNFEQKKEFLYERMNGIQIEKDLKNKLEFFLERYQFFLKRRLERKQNKSSFGNPQLNKFAKSLFRNIERISEKFKKYNERFPDKPQKTFDTEFNNKDSFTKFKDEIEDYIIKNKSQLQSENPKKRMKSIEDFILFITKISNKSWIQNNIEFKKSRILRRGTIKKFTENPVLRKLIQNDRTIQNYVKTFIQKSSISELINKGRLLAPVKPYRNIGEKISWQFDRFVEMEMIKKKVIDTYRFGNIENMNIYQILETENYIPKSELIPKDIYSITKINEDDFKNKFNERKIKEKHQMTEEEKNLMKKMEIISRKRIYRADGSYYYHSEMSDIEKVTTKKLSEFLNYDVLFKQFKTPDYYTKEDRLILNNRIFEMSNGLIENSLSKLNDKSLYLCTIGHPLRHSDFSEVKEVFFEDFVQLFGDKNESDFDNKKLIVEKRYQTIRDLFVKKNNDDFKKYLNFEWMLFNEICKKLNTIRTPVILKIVNSILNFIFLDENDETTALFEENNIKKEFEALVVQIKDPKSKTQIQKKKNQAFIDKITNCLSLSHINFNEPLSDEIVFEDRIDEYFLVNKLENNSLFSVFEKHSLIQSNQGIIEDFKKKQEDSFKELEEHIENQKEKSLKDEIRNFNESILPYENIEEYYNKAMDYIVEEVGKQDKYANSPILRMTNDLVVDNFRSLNNIRNLDDLNSKNMKDILELYILRKHPKVKKIFEDAGISIDLVDELSFNSENSNFIEDLLLKSEDLKLPMIKELVKKFHNLSKGHFQTQTAQKEIIHVDSVRLSTNEHSLKKIDPKFSLARKIVNNTFFNQAKKEMKSVEAQRFFKSQEQKSVSSMKWEVYDNYCDEMIKKDFIEQFK